jgi:hypothetical protein
LVVPPGVVDNLLIWGEGEGGLRPGEEIPLGVGDGGAKEVDEVSPLVIPAVAEAVGVERDKSVAEYDLLIEGWWVWRTGDTWCVWWWPSSAKAFAFPVGYAKNELIGSH